MIITHKYASYCLWIFFFYCSNNNENRQQSADSQKFPFNWINQFNMEPVVWFLSFRLKNALHFICLNCLCSYSMLLCISFFFFWFTILTWVGLGCELYMYDVNVKLIWFGLGFIMIWLLLLVILVGNYWMSRAHEFVRKKRSSSLMNSARNRQFCYFFIWKKCHESVIRINDAKNWHFSIQNNKVEVILSLLLKSMSQIRLPNQNYLFSNENKKNVNIFHVRTTTTIMNNLCGSHKQTLTWHWIKNFKKK